jgi:hypothetical protein
VIRGVASAKGFPVLLMNRYSKGILYLLTIPENMAEIYNLPQGVITAIKGYLQKDFPVRIDAPAQLSLFAYDNKTFVVQSFRHAVSTVSISVAGEGLKLRNLLTGKVLKAAAGGEGRTAFEIKVQAHSYLGFAIVGN